MKNYQLRLTEEQEKILIPLLEALKIDFRKLDIPKQEKPKNKKSKV